MQSESLKLPSSQYTNCPVPNSVLGPGDTKMINPAIKKCTVSKFSQRNWQSRVGLALEVHLF